MKFESTRPSAGEKNPPFSSGESCDEESVENRDGLPPQTPRPSPGYSGSLGREKRVNRAVSRTRAVIGSLQARAAELSMTEATATNLSDEQSAEPAEFHPHRFRASPERDQS
ncbi:hypothetical protein GCM10009603_17870 [Nocardiopsis exhalans]